MKQPIEKLKDKLSELFQLDQADLDFGIYRIMNARRAEITRFLEKDLLPQVKDEFSIYKSADKTALKADLDKAIEGAKSLWVDPNTVPKVKELQAQYDSSSVDLTALENEVYSRLYDFFNRYYDNGDFISMRRYKKDVYAIPYEGEEVKLHWANADQYYIKTTEYFRDYAFRIDGKKLVHFKIIEADTEKDNIKSGNGNDRRFFLSEDKPVSEDKGELIIRFEYRPDHQKRGQDDLNKEIIRGIFDDLKKGKLAAWHQPLTSTIPTKKDQLRTVLEKHLADYTRRNTFDYFIHKDLGGFLRRELDFYIKNEVMHLDDVENESAPRVEQYLSKIKVIRKIAHKIIDFLAQIEDYQKKLWIKKKFVIEANYCITLDRVPEELYPEIAANKAQHDEWVKLFAIDEIERDLSNPGYSKPLTVKFLKANNKLVLDTRFFDETFKSRLIASIENFDGQCDGLLINSENFQALALLHERYNDEIDCIYIDPPYNTDASAILYKNDYKDSSWLSLMENRLGHARDFLSSNGVLCVAIDDKEASELRLLLTNMFVKELGIALIRSNPAGRKTKGRLAPAHEFAMFYGKSEGSTPMSLDITEKRLARYPLKDEKGNYAWANFIRSGSGDRREDRPTMYYPIFVNSKNKLRIPEMEWDIQNKTYILLENPKSDEKSVYPIIKQENKIIEKRWHRGHGRVINELEEYRVRRSSDGEISIDFKTRMDEDALPTTWWDKKEYASANYGALELKDLFGKKVFDFAKAHHLVKDCLTVSCDNHSPSTILDFFAGSGTSGHATITLNREDDGKRKYILVEMGDYFDTVLKPRIAKVVYSERWEDGKPTKRESGISHCFKYIRLESYEDTLANLELKRTDAQKELLNLSDSFRESYMLKYMLDTESGGSQSLLNIDAFEDPFNYKLLVGTGSVGETKAVNVDLVETFNWLIGLRVRHMDHIRGFRVIEGMSPENEKVLIIWRNIKDKSSKDLDDFFKKQQYNTMDMEFDVIYVNGDNNLMNLPMTSAGGETEPRYKVRLIEEEFKRLMFDVKDI
jgi:adenine-specific DNA-methyltransferase